MEDIQIQLLIEAGETPKTLGDIKDSIKNITKAMQEVKLGSKQFKDLQAVLVENREVVRNLKKEFDTLHNVTLVAKTMAGAFGITASAVSLFGIENKKLEETLTKVTAALALVNSVKEFAEGLKLAKSANDALNASLLTSPIFLLGAVIVAVGAALYVFGDASQTAKDKQEKLNDELKKYNDLLEQRAELQNENKNLELENDYDKRIIAAKNETEATKLQIEYNHKLIESLQKRQKAQDQAAESAKAGGGENDPIYVGLKNAVLKTEKEINDASTRIKTAQDKIDKDILDKKKAAHDKEIKEFKESQDILQELIAKDDKYNEDINKKESKNLEEIHNANQVNYEDEQRNIAVQEYKIGLLTSEEKKKKSLKDLDRIKLQTSKEYVIALQNERKDIEASNIPLDEKRKLLDAIDKIIKDQIATQEKLNSTSVEGAKKFSESTVKILDQITYYGQAAASVISDIFTLIGQSVQQQADSNIAQFERETARYIQLQQDKLDAGIITSEQFRVYKENADRELEKKKRAESHKAFKTQKALAITMATINTALAVVNALATAPTIIAGVIMAALAAVAGGVQIGIIASQKEPGFAKGGVFQAANGGLVNGVGTSTSDSINARLSNGESIINARGTQMFAPLLSAINQVSGGVAFAGQQNIINNPADVKPTVVENSNTTEPNITVSISEAEITRVQNKVAKLKLKNTL